MIQGLTMVIGSTVSLEKGNETQLLLLKYSNSGEEQQHAFDLIVVLTKSKMPPEELALMKNLS